MKVRVLFVALALALTAIAVPAVADHIVEPQFPITSLRLDVYQYGHRDTTLLSACDGSEKVTFSNLRVEPLVTWERDAARVNPSEHFTVFIGVLPGRIVNGEFRRQLTGGSGTEWHHQNVPPHRGNRPYEVTQWDTYMAVLGYWQVTVIITGEESGVVFTSSCVFERVAP